MFTICQKKKKKLKKKEKERARCLYRGSLKQPKEIFIQDAARLGLKVSLEAREMTNGFEFPDLPREFPRNLLRKICSSFDFQ